MKSSQLTYRLLTILIALFSVRSNVLAGLRPLLIGPIGAGRRTMGDAAEHQLQIHARLKSNHQVSAQGASKCFGF